MTKKAMGVIFALMLIFVLFCACSLSGMKPGSISVIYFIISILSLIMLLGYFAFIKKKDIWFIVLFISVFVVNTGYFMLSVSETTGEALMYNRLSYLGSVFLPLSMIMNVLNVTKLHYKKWLPCVLAAISIGVFFIVASPGYLDIYYKSAVLEKIHGVSVLKKEYGSWHFVYVIYLIGYFIIMSASAMYAILKKRVDNHAHAVILIAAVFVNICVWIMEKFVRTEFEILSVSYIISEIFLITLYMMIQHQEYVIAVLKAEFSSKQSNNQKTTTIDKSSPEFIEQCNFIKEQLPSLTSSERAIYNCYLDGKSTKEILSEMSITENTLKFHNKNIYSKLGVTSRKQLIVYAKEIENYCLTLNTLNNNQ